jgi:hypothetical protein
MEHGMSALRSEFSTIGGARSQIRRSGSGISLSFDFEGTGRPEEQSPQVLDFLRRQGATFDNVLSSEDADAMYKQLDLASIPAVFVYDRQGKLRERFQETDFGTPERPLYERVDALVTRLLQENDGGPRR